MQNAELQLKIQNELKEAQLARSETVVSTLRMLVAAINNKEIEKRAKLSKTEPSAAPQASLSPRLRVGADAPLKREKLEELAKLTDEEVIDIIMSEMRKRKEAALEFEKGGRMELAEKEKKELDILRKYLPEQLSEEEIRKLAQEAVAALRASLAPEEREKVGAKEPKDMGRVMAELMPKVKGRADGAAVTDIVKKLLASS